MNTRTDTCLGIGVLPVDKCLVFGNFCGGLQNKYLSEHYFVGSEERAKCLLRSLSFVVFNTDQQPQCSIVTNYHKPQWLKLPNVAMVRIDLNGAPHM